MKAVKSPRKRSVKRTRRVRRTRRAKRVKSITPIVVAAPKKRRRRRARRVKAPKAMKVARKARRRGRRRSKRPFTFLKAWRKRRRGFSKFKTAKGHTFWQSPKAKYAENSWKGQPKRHRRARKLGWRRHGRASYASNPGPLGRLGGKLTGAKFYMLPTMGELKSQGPVKSILFGLGGLVTTSLIGMGMEKICEQFKITDEKMVDGTRIFGKLAIGTAISWAMGKYVLKSNTAAKTWQTGVYISTGLDIAGTILKYVTRETSQVKLGGTIKAPNTLGNIAMGALGAGSIGNWWYENQVRDAIYKTGRVEVVGNEKGHIGILHPATGKIILSGPEKQMASILGAIQRSVLKVGDDQEQDKGIGEDITIEA